MRLHTENAILGLSTCVKVCKVCVSCTHVCVYWTMKTRYNFVTIKRLPCQNNSYASFNKAINKQLQLNNVKQINVNRRYTPPAALRAVVTLRHLLSGSRNSRIAFEVERITNKSRLSFSHKALRVQMSSSHPVLVAFIVQRKNKVHGYAVTWHRVIRHWNALIRFTMFNQQFQTSSFFWTAPSHCTDRPFLATPSSTSQDFVHIIQ